MVAVCISTEWSVGLGPAKLTVTLHTLMRISYVERVARLNHQALTRSTCRVSTAEVVQNVRLGAQRVRHPAGALVPDPFVCFARPALPGGALGSSTPNPPSL